MIDFNALFQPQQPTPYPQNPLASLFRQILAAKLLQEEQREREKRRTTEDEERQRAKAFQNYNVLNNVVQQYTAAGQTPPQQLLIQLDQIQRQLVGAGLGTELVPQTTQTPSSGGFGPGSQTHEVPQFTVPGQGEFRTLQEMAQAAGMKLRPNVDPTQNPVMLRQRGIDLNQLFINPETERMRERAEADARVKQAEGTWGIQQIFAKPELKGPYLRDFELAYGRPYPTEQVPTTVQVPTQRREEGGLSRYIAPTGTTQVQTGTETRPIMPQTAMDFVVDFPGMGKIQFSQLPAGAQTAIINRIFESKEKVEATLSDGTRVKVSPEKALELDLRRDSMVTFIDPVTKARVTVPATSLPSFFPRKAPGGGGGGATETQARIKTSLMQRYLAGDNLNEREQRVLFGATGEDIIPAKDRKILELWRQNLDPLTNEPRDANLAARLKPDVDRIVNQMVTPTAQPRGGAPTQRAAQVLQVFRQHRQPVPIENWNQLTEQERGWLQSRGVGSNASQQQPAPSTVSSDVSNAVRTLAVTLRQQKIPWNVARLRILRELGKRRVNINDPKLQQAVDQIGQQVYQGR